MKPFINLSEVVFESSDEPGHIHQYGIICERIGAQALGYNLTKVPPGSCASPFHNHHGNEEMFLIIQGKGTLKFGTEAFAITKHDVIACPAGGQSVAHQIINDGDEELLYLSLSTKNRLDICEFPTDHKVSVMAGDYEQMDFSGSYPL